MKLLQKIYAFEQTNRRFGSILCSNVATVKQILEGRHVNRGITSHLTTLQALFTLYTGTSESGKQIKRAHEYDTNNQITGQVGIL